MPDKSQGKWRMYKPNIIVVKAKKSMSTIIMDTITYICIVLGILVVFYLLGALPV